MHSVALKVQSQGKIYGYCSRGSYSVALMMPNEFIFGLTLLVIESMISTYSSDSTTIRAMNRDTYGNKNTIYSCKL